MSCRIMEGIFILCPPSKYLTVGGDKLDTVLESNRFMRIPTPYTKRDILSNLKIIRAASRLKSILPAL